MQEFVRVASTGDLEPGQIMLADVDDKRIMLVNVDGQYYALQEECTHAACPLSEGNLEGQVIECPCHGSEFDVTTGVALTRPPTNRWPCTPLGWRKVTYWSARPVEGSGL